MAWHACLSSLFLIVVCFKKKKKNVLIWLCWVLAAEHRIFCCGEWVSSVVPGLGCPVACGILVSQPGIKPASPALEGGFLTTGPPGKFPGSW